jgi:hypothetical protein
MVTECCACHGYEGRKGIQRHYTTRLPCMTYCLGRVGRLFRDTEEPQCELLIRIRFLV